MNQIQPDKVVKSEQDRPKELLDEMNRIIKKYDGLIGNIPPNHNYYELLKEYRQLINNGE